MNLLCVFAVCSASLSYQEVNLPVAAAPPPLASGGRWCVCGDVQGLVFTQHTNCAVSLPKGSFCRIRPKTLLPINLGVRCLWMQCRWLHVGFHMILSEQIFLFTILPCRHAGVGVWLASNTKLLAQSASPRQV